MKDPVHYVRVFNRTDFMKLASYLARAIDTRFFHDPKKIPVVSIHGPSGCGKSLFVESMMKTWMDDYTLRDAVTVPHDCKMFLEKGPCNAADRTLFKDAAVSGQRVRLAFNSAYLFNGYELMHARNNGFSDCKTGGVLLVTNDHHTDETAPKYERLMLVEFQGVTSPNNYDRYARITVECATLQSDPRFAAYMEHLTDFRGRKGHHHIRKPDALTPA